MGFWQPAKLHITVVRVFVTVAFGRADWTSVQNERPPDRSRLVIVRQGVRGFMAKYPWRSVLHFDSPFPRSVRSATAKLFVCHVDSVRAGRRDCAHQAVRVIVSLLI